MIIGAQEGKTVFAVASGKGVAGIHVVRLSGPHCRQVLTGMTGGVPKPRYAALRNLRRYGSDKIIDEALVLWFPAPSSYTGEDVVEFHVHGSLAVTRLLFTELMKYEGLVPADPGVFTRRAFLNQKMDLTEIEALSDLIHAETESQIELALKHYQGFGSRQYGIWREDLKSLLAFMEASIDFSEEELSDDLNAKIDTKLQHLTDEIEQSLNTAIHGERLRSGFRIVLAGDVNAGKSTLLNTLARRNVAIVSDQPGTTRDVLQVQLDLLGMPVLVSDTAGLRKSKEDIEKEGIKRAVSEISKADLVLHIKDRFSSGIKMPLDGIFDKVETLIVWNKIDLGEMQETQGEFYISAKTGQGIEKLLNHLAEKASAGLQSGIDSVVIRQRHKLYLQQCVEAIKQAREFTDEQFDLKVEMIRIAIDKIGVIIGKVGVEEILDVVFAEFCIGK